MIPQEQHEHCEVFCLFFYAYSLVCALKLCLLDTGRAPGETELLFTEDPSQPLSHCPPLSAEPPVSQRYLLRWNSGQQEESMELPHERLVNGGLGESHFVFALGTKHHAMENSQSIVARQRHHN